MRLGRIGHGPLFRPIARKNGGVSAERLSDKHVARLVQKCALAAGIRGDLTEGERKKAFGGHSLARRPRLLGADRRGACAKAPRPRQRRNDPPLPEEARPLSGQSHQGRGAVSEATQMPTGAFERRRLAKSGRVPITLPSCARARPSPPCRATAPSARGRARTPLPSPSRSTRADIRRRI